MNGREEIWLTVKDLHHEAGVDDLRDLRVSVRGVKKIDFGHVCLVVCVCVCVFFF